VLQGNLTQGASRFTALCLVKICCREMHSGFNYSVSQTVICGSSGGPRQSTGCSRRKGVAKILPHNEQMNSTPIHVCTKVAFVG
jgi:hypothetical protein